MQLTEHFSLEELALTNHHDLVQENLEYAKMFLPQLSRLCGEFLEPARRILGRPIHITSAVRCPRLNQIVGGSLSPVSRHVLCEAADFTVPGMAPAQVFNALAWAPDFRYGQIICEFGAWVHGSIVDEDRYPSTINQKLVAIRSSDPADLKKTRTEYIAVTSHIV